MKRSWQLVLMICLILTAFVIGISLIRKNEIPPELSSNKVIMIDDQDKSVTNTLINKRIVKVQSWPVETLGKPLFCIVQSFDRDPHYEGAGEKLIVYNESGVKLYEDYFTSVEDMYLSAALRTDASQLVIEVNYGGNTTNFLQMLNYHDGKVVKVPIKGDADFDSGAEVRPQFRRGITPAKEPYQIMLREGVGVASSVEKITHVYRYKDGAYQYVGKFNQHDVDDYIEKLMTEGKLGRND